MVKINQIALSNFRNFQSSEISFYKKSNIFYGDNGSGKTNILEAISLLSKGRGIRNASIIDLIKKNQNNFLIKSNVQINSNYYNVNVLSQKKDIKLSKLTKLNDDSSKESISFLNNNLSYLIFTPEMERLFQSSPSYRRNFIDRLIFSEKNDYNKLINKYKKNILERNKILIQDQIDNEWINSIESEIAEIGLQIYQLRKNQLDILNKNISSLNSSNDYQFNIIFTINDPFYSSELIKDTYKSSLYNLRGYDKKFGGSKIGPHKSDINALINKDYDASLLSTGQQKTIVLMMLLSQCEFLTKIKKTQPILLLDEICSHLDSNNRQILLDMINKFDIQLFLTGTEKSLFSFISTNVNFYNITEI